MFISKLGQIIYGIFALASVILILISMFTPGWRQVIVKDSNEIINMDLLGWTCFKSQTENSTKIKGKFDNCVEWYKNRPLSEKAVVGGMVVALLATVLALLWNTFGSCLCYNDFRKPMLCLTCTASIILGVSLTVFYYKNNVFIDDIKLGSGVEEVINSLNYQNNISYSFYTACGALLLQVANVIVGSLIICSSNYRL